MWSQTHRHASDKPKSQAVVCIDRLTQLSQTDMHTRPGKGGRSWDGRAHRERVGGAAAAFAGHMLGAILYGLCWFATQVRAPTPRLPLGPPISSDQHGRRGTHAIINTDQRGAQAYGDQGSSVSHAHRRSVNGVEIHTNMSCIERGREREKERENGRATRGRRKQGRDTCAHKGAKGV
jgi:hypothetical protein